MRIADKSAFLDHRKKLTVKTIKGDSKSFAIALNFSVGDYYRMYCLLDNYEKTENDFDNVVITAEIAALILRTSDKSITMDWVIRNISLQQQETIIEAVLIEIQELLNADYLKIPDIEVPENNTVPKNDAAKEQFQKRQEIKRCQKLLTNVKEINLLGDILLVMSKTHNSYQDVMKMPFLIFRGIVKNIIVNENRVNEDYNLAYLKYEVKKHSDEIINNLAVKPTHKGADDK